MYVIDTISTFFSFSTLKVSLFFLLPSGLALLGCCVSEQAINTVKQVLESIRPALNLQAQFPVESLKTANQVKQYLERHSLQFCVLLVDGETVKDAYENLPARKVEYEDLLKMAATRVGKKSVNCKCEKRNHAYFTILKLRKNSFFLYFQCFVVVALNYSIIFKMEINSFLGAIHSFF